MRGARGGRAGWPDHVAKASNSQARKNSPARPRAQKMSAQLEGTALPACAKVRGRAWGARRRVLGGRECGRGAKKKKKKKKKFKFKPCLK